MSILVGGSVVDLLSSSQVPEGRYMDHTQLEARVNMLDLKTTTLVDRDQNDGHVWF